MNMIDRHVAHEKYESDPWHQRSFDVLGNGVGSNRTDENCSNPIPEREEANEVEE